VFMYACVGAALVASVLALVGNEPRRIFALAGSGAAAVGAAVVIYGFQDPKFAFASAGLACVMAAAPARAAGVLASAAVAGGMRTDDLAEMGDGLNRMRSSSIALLLAGLVLGLSATGALIYGVSGKTWLGVLAGEAVLLIAISAARVFLGVALGPLRRRRAFEPDRVREVAAESLGWPYLLMIAGAVLLVASDIRGWLDFLDVNGLNAIVLVYWLTLAFVLGIAIGSFVNVAVARLPVEKSLVWPGP